MQAASPEKAMARFWSKADQSGGPDACWPWMAFVNPVTGYGRGYIQQGRTGYAHRLSWSLVNGPIPRGMCICHHCDNRRCVNPAHLFLGTYSDNIQDMLRKGREGHHGPIGLKSHCAKGHPFDAANTRIRREGTQVCRTCHRERNAALKRAKRAAFVS